MAAFAAFCLGIFVASARTYITKQQLYAALRLLRFVAAGNDESLAPPATWLLDELRNEPVPAVPARFGPLPPITVPNADGFTLVGSITWVVGALFAIVWPGLALASASNEAGWWGVSFGIGGLAAIIIGIVLLRIAKHIRRPLTVSADEIGLRWTPPGRGAAEVQIRWSEARSF
ncbi:MAG TPA: hypothetical protein VKT52_05205, partial [Ktedonobacterales bacterium]|nr:hypothetical protein [Ktedonobacterales bacterium]